MSKVFDENFYTEDFDQEIIDQIVRVGWKVSNKGLHLKNKYLKYGANAKCFWTSDETFDITSYKKLTKQEFKEKIGMCNKTGYRLADGTYSSEYKVGDKFEVIDNIIFKIGDVVTLDNNDGSNAPWFENGKRLASNWSRLKAYKKKKQFTKSDLLDGMRVVYREGYERIVFGKTLYEVDKTGKLYPTAELCRLSEDLIHMEFSSLDFMQVTDRDGTVLFTRQEEPTKSPAHIELDKLQEQIAQLQQQANKLQQSL